MFVKNKIESDSLIQKLNLNRIIENYFKKNEIEKLKHFLIQNPCSYYNIRDKSSPMGRFLYKLTPDEVLAQAEKYDFFSVCESLAEADKTLVLQGEILITEDYKIIASLSDIKGISNRQAMQSPEYRFEAEMIYNPYLKKEEKPWSKIPDVRGLNTVIDYLFPYELIGVIVEFSLFDIPVGTKKENIIIWELRTNY